MNAKAQIGCRIECDGAKGTIKWIGEIPSFEGTWYGIDWDDKERGKHDGALKGTQYFRTRYEKSGTFIRSTKIINLGVTLEEAVRGRYQDETTIEEELTDQLKRNINARFVEVVGMDKVGKQQSQLDCLKTVVLDGWSVRDGGTSDLHSLLPRLQELNVSNTLLSSWEQVAYITRQLPNLKFLNVSGNLLLKPSDPLELVESTRHVTNVVMNKMLTYSWDDLVSCAKMFPNVEKLQLAFNDLTSLGPIPEGVFEQLRDLDIGVNPIREWSQVCHLGKLPKLETINLNNCNLNRIEFSETAPAEKSPLFPTLRSLMVSNNPFSYWESVVELDKLSSIEELILSPEEVVGRGNYFMEYTLARIRNLKMLNRTKVTSREKRDYQLFYLRSFSNEYYTNGGTSDPLEANLTSQFWIRHPSYLAIAKVHGAPMDERNHSSQKSQKLRDLKIELLIVPESTAHPQSVKSFLPATRISKLKMMIKRMYKLDGAAKITLLYCPLQENEKFEISLDNDTQDISFYSMKSGNKLLVRW